LQSVKPVKLGPNPFLPKSTPEASKKPE
jgi:hypothetical protein